MPIDRQKAIKMGRALNKKIQDDMMKKKMQQQMEDNMDNAENAKNQQIGDGINKSIQQKMRDSCMKGDE